MKWMVYPASRYVSVLARYPEEVPECEEIRFVTPEGWGADGGDFSSLDGGLPTGVQLSNDFDRALDKADAVLFADGPIPLPEKYLLGKIARALDAKKQVVLEKIPEELADKLPLDRVEILQENDPVSVTKPQMQDPEIRTIPVPVVFVLGTGPHTNKLEVQTALGKYFREQGYSVSQVASRNLGNFLDCHTVPESLFSQAATTKDRIILLNRYFHKIYLRDKPEVMIIGLPGGIMPVNPIRFDELGEKAYLISQAVTPDAAVLCTYTFEFNQEYVKEMQAICQYRLGTAVKHLVVSGTGMGLSSETSQTEYSMVPGSLIQEKCSFSFSGISCHYALDPQDLERLGASVLRELTENL